MKKKTVHFLTVSFTVIILVCAGVLVFAGSYLSKKNQETMEEIGDVYMSEMSLQLQRHFTSIIELRTAMEKGLVIRTPGDEYAEFNGEMVEDLTAAGEARGFTYLGLYDMEGNCDVIYGEEIEIVNEDTFMESVITGEPKVAIGKDKSEDDLIVMALATDGVEIESYPMTSGIRSQVIVAGLPINNIEEAMYLDIDESLIYSHIIRADGSFVLQNADTEGGNYYDWLLEKATYSNGTAQENVERMKEAMKNREEYSVILTASGQERHLYSIPLENSNWFLINVMPHGVLEEIIANQKDETIVVMVATLVIVIAVLLLIFVVYLRMSAHQMSMLENAKDEAKKANLAKSEFLSNMSHDIRTPMNAIVGMTTIAISNMDNPEQVKDCLRKIALSSRHLLGLINDVLDMSKIESGKLPLNMQQVSLSETMDSLVGIIQPQIKGKKQKFDVFIKDIQTENIICDGVRLNQILLNMLSNALKFTPEGGKINVILSQENSPKGEKFVRTHFIVEDTGIGMTKEFQKKIFESFTREDNSRVRKIEGTGLGMTITKYIVDMMGGTIEVESEVEKGSRFHVTIDCEKVNVKEAEMKLPEWNLLVVDDDKELCSSAVATLKELGINADQSASGQKAVEMVAKRHEEEEDYHIVLLDWKMPNMDGIKTAKEIRRVVGDAVPILLISAYNWSDIEAEARAAGINGFIAKPLFKSTLYYGLEQFKEGEQVNKNVTTEERPDFTGKRLLIAEDNELNWEIARELLSSYGFAVEWAENGRVCVNKFDMSPAGTYDAILMDIRMPVMDGYEATRMIRALDRPDAAKIPIIAMTADAFSEDIQRAFENGMDAHIAKPIEIRDLIRLVQKFV